MAGAEGVGKREIGQQSGMDSGRGNGSQAVEGERK